MFTRFSIFPGHTSDPFAQNPILAFCNKNSRVYFFDLARLEKFYDVTVALPGERSCKYKAEAKAAERDTDPDTTDADAIAKTLSFPTDHNPRAHPFLHPFQRRTRGGHSTGARTLARLAREVSPSESTNSELTNSNATSNMDESSHGKGKGTGKIDWTRSWKGWGAKYELGEPARKIEAHHMEMVKGIEFTGRQVAWSADGVWCVVVGSGGSIGVLGRWGR